MDTTTKKRMKSFEQALTGGFEHGVLHVLEHDENGTEIVMFLMDMEYDPARITFDPEGGACIHADGHKWHMFTADQLRFIADQTEEAKSMWEKHFEEVERE